jgi:hypothetical protein
MASSKQSASITIPADYLEDVRTALVKGIDRDSGMFRIADPVERDSSALMLRRDMAVLDQALVAIGQGHADSRGRHDEQSACAHARGPGQAVRRTTRPPPKLRPAPNGGCA